MISTDKPLQDGKEILYVVVFPPWHQRPRHLDVPFINICFLSPTPPIVAIVSMPEVLDAQAKQQVPHNARQPRSLLIYNAAVFKAERRHVVLNDKEIGIDHTALHDGALAVNASTLS